MSLTPKEKADQLFKTHINYYGFDTDEINDSKALKSAIITVDEILWALNDIDGEINISNYIDWWEEVGEELNLMYE